MKVLLLILMFGILLISSASAQLTYKPNEQAEIKISCFDVDSDMCDSSTACNVTIFLPNMTVFVDDKDMTNQVNYFNYTTSELPERGEYNGVVNCDKSGVYGYQSFSFVVTDIPATGQGNVAIGILLSVLGLAFLFVFIGFKFSESDKLFPIALFFILISLILSIYVIHLGYIYSRDILTSTMASSGQWRIYIGLLYGLIGMSFLGLLFLIVKTLKELKIRKSIQQHGEGWDEKSQSYK